jgi:hypothetical protein
LLCGTNLRIIVRLAHVDLYSWGERSYSSRERANDTGLAASLISKMQSSLSIGGRSAGDESWR